MAWLPATVDKIPNLSIGLAHLMAQGPVSDDLENHLGKCFGGGDDAVDALLAREPADKQHPFDLWTAGHLRGGQKLARQQGAEQTGTFCPQAARRGNHGLGIANHCVRALHQLPVEACHEPAADSANPAVPVQLGQLVVEGMQPEDHWHLHALGEASSHQPIGPRRCHNQHVRSHFSQPSMHLNR